MANADVIYAIAVQGAEDAVKAFGKVSAATKSVEVAQDNMAAKANHYADAFKKVSRDIGTVGGQAAQAFTHIADEALSVVGMLTGGGLTAALAGVGIGVGAVVLAYKAWNDETAESKRLADQAVESHNKLLASAKKNADDAFASTTRMNAEQLRRVSIEKQLLVVALQLDQQKRLAEAASQEGNAVNRAIAMAKIRKESDAEIAKASAESEAALGKFNVAQARATEMEVTRVKLDEQKERGDRAKKAEDDRQSEELRASERADAQMRRDQSDAAAREQAADDARLDKMRKDDEKRRADEKKSQEEWDKEEQDAASRVADAFGEAAKRKEDAAIKAAAAFKKMRDEIMNIGFAAAAFKNVTAPTFDAGMMVINSATGLANKYLDEFGTINRDNWRDMLSFSKDKQAAFAAEAQAALWSLARQAAPKAIYENAEGIASAAAAAGEYGKGNVAGGVLLTAAAVGHYAASAAYGTIAVAAGGGSLAIGAARGKGGIVAASPGGGGGGMSAGPGASPRSGGGGFTGGGGSTSPGGGAVNITYVYEAGSINAADERATARTVADGVGSARGSWFERRRMERRV